MSLERAHIDRTFKILFIGDSSVGKTCLMFRYAEGKFSEKFTPTIGVDFKMKTIKARGKTVKLQLWDTAGQEKFFTIAKSYYRNANAIILVYDRTEASTFQSVARWMKTIDENAPDNVLRILVGNKNDLHNRLVISTQDGERLAEKYNVEFFETSAKSETNTTISEMFDHLAEKLVDLAQPKSEESSDTIHLNGNQSTFAGCCSFVTAFEK